MQFKIISILISFIFISLTRCSDSITESEYLIITHPTLMGEWVNNLASLQESRGYSVGIFNDLENGITSNEDLRSLIRQAYDNGIQVKHILLAGAGAEIGELETGYKGFYLGGSRNASDIVNSTENNFIPFYYESRDDILFSAQEYVPTDDLYIWDEEDNWLEDVSIGRIPARSAEELNNFTNKLVEYYSEFYIYQNWQDKVLFLSQNIDCSITYCSGYVVDYMYDEVINHVFDILEEQINLVKATDLLMDSGNSYPCGSKEIILENKLINELNNGTPIINYMGTSSGPDMLGGYLWAQNHSHQSNFNQLNNQGKYPFFTGISCNIGRTQLPNEDNSIVRDLLFLQNKGIISSFSPTILTDQWGCQELSKRLYGEILNNQNVNSGHLCNMVKQSFENEVPSRIWMSRAFILYGDPSMPLMINQIIQQNISADKSWSGSIVIDQSISVQTGSTLSISTGTGIFFAEDSKLIIEEGATLKIEGTKSFPVVLKGKGDDNTWAGIEVNGGRVEINHTEITNVTGGGAIVLIDDSNGFIKNSAISNNTTGIIVWDTGNEVVIENNEIKENGVGIASIQGDPIIKSNIIKNNEFVGLLLMRGADAEVKYNQISYNGLNDFPNGVKGGVVIYSSSPVLTRTVTDGFYGGYPFNNQINNNNIGVYISYFGNPNLGTYEVNGNIIYGGFNKLNENELDLFRSNTAENWAQMDDIHASQIFAQANYWYADAGDVSDPANIIGDGIRWRPVAPAIVDPGVMDEPDNPLHIGNINDEQENYFQSRASYMEYIEFENTTSGGINTAIGGIKRTSDKLGDSEEQITILENYGNNSDNEVLSTTAKTHLIWTLDESGNTDAAIDLAESLYDEYSGTDLESYYALELALLYDNYDEGLGRITEEETNHSAEQLYEKILQDHPESIAADILRLLKGILTPQFPEASVFIPEKYLLHQAYPNPFNPDTHLTYDLPEETRINISIYDITGRLVKELVNASHQPGRYNVTWNAEQISSGVYFVKMLAYPERSSTGGVPPPYSASQKVILLK